jgi:hypothetical protein
MASLSFGIHGATNFFPYLLSVTAPSHLTSVVTVTQMYRLLLLLTPLSISSVTLSDFSMLLLLIEFFWLDMIGVLLWLGIFVY